MSKLISILLIAIALSTTPVLAKEISSSVHQQNQQLEVNLNKASAEELSNVLTGVGLSKAAEIVSYRNANGPFKTLKDLAKVKGIGTATIEKNLEKLVL